jgi:radical SAM superfamily enzyme YgiQ (UPF0313 family)
MRILLIATNQERLPYPVAPLGAASVAAALKHAGHDVALLDLFLAADPSRAVPEAIQRHEPSWIGVSVRNLDNLTYGDSRSYLPEIKEVVSLCRRHAAAPVVLGGSGFSLAPAAALRYTEADWGVVGEGEETAVAFCRALTAGEDPSAVAGVVSPSGSFTRRPPTSPGAWPRPARELIANDAYLARGGMGNVQGKRGCPLSCIYCTYPMLEGERLRVREPAEIVDELAQMHRDHGIDYAYFVDDAFNLPREHAEAICEEILRRKLEIGWTCFAVPRDTDAAFCRLLLRAGCRGVEFGTDSGSGVMLARLGKGFEIDDVVTASAACHDAGLPCAHYLVLGGPGETPETVEETFRLIRRVKPTAVIALAGLRVYAGTELHPCFRASTWPKPSARRSWTASARRPPLPRSTWCPRFT